MFTFAPLAGKATDGTILGNDTMSRHHGSKWIASHSTTNGTRTCANFLSDCLIRCDITGWYPLHYIIHFLFELCWITAPFLLDGIPRQRRRHVACWQRNPRFVLPLGLIKPLYHTDMQPARFCSRGSCRCWLAWMLDAAIVILAASNLDYLKGLNSGVKRD